MKSCFSTVGGCFVLVLVLIGIAFAIFIPRAVRLDREATAYVKGVVPTIVSPWNSQALLAQATPELLSSLKSPADVQSLFARFQKLGALKHLGDPTGGIRSKTYIGHGTYGDYRVPAQFAAGNTEGVGSTVNPESGNGTYGTYLIPAQFAAGDAELLVQVKQVEGGWKIQGFRVNSKSLLDGPTPAPTAKP